ncbi:hypothetical protein, partial [Anaerocolumna jejuensis]|uniref:hypothetical protein n=1 Tax=Anaerocolumna jejuensis TaxID=259063 RepID=UPI001A9A43B8
MGTDDDFGLPFVIFSFGVPNSTKMPAAVPGRLNYTKLAGRLFQCGAVSSDSGIILPRNSCC